MSVLRRWFERSLQLQPGRNTCANWRLIVVVAAALIALAAYLAANIFFASTCKDTRDPSILVVFKKVHYNPFVPIRAC